MSTLLIKNAACIATFDNTQHQTGQTHGQELKNASIFIKGNVIEAIGLQPDLPDTADEVINAQGHLVIPGLINTHHHMRNIGIQLIK